MSGLTVSRLFVYPIKSLGGMELDAAEVEARGFRHDRRWMLVDGDGMFISQRLHPRMALARARVEDDRLVARARDADPGTPAPPRTRPLRAGLRVERRGRGRLVRRGRGSVVRRGSRCVMSPGPHARRDRKSRGPSPRRRRRPGRLRRQLPVPAALRGVARRPEREAGQPSTRKPLLAQHRRCGLRPLRGGSVAEGARWGRRLPGRQALLAVRHHHSGPRDRRKGEGAAEDARFVSQGRRQSFLGRTPSATDPAA